MRRTGIVAFLWRLTRTTSIVVALAVLLALVAGVASLAVAQGKPPGGGTPSSPLLLGVENTANAVTTLINSATGAALNLQVQKDSPPLTVNSDAGTATNLSADKVDGKDSTALGVTTKTNHQRTGECGNQAINADNECAPVEVTVPTGKEYNVTVFSSFVTRAVPNTSVAIYWCPAVKGGTFATATCMFEEGTPEFPYDALGAGPNQPSPTAGSGEIGPLPAGTYTFSTNLRPTGELDDDVLSSTLKAHTTVLVTDASATGPPITGTVASSPAG